MNVSAYLQSLVIRIVLPALAKSLLLRSWVSCELLELKPVVHALWTIVPSRVLAKLYQEASEVYRGNLGYHLSSSNTPCGEKVQKAANLRNKLSPVSTRTYFRRAEGKKG